MLKRSIALLLLAVSLPPTAHAQRRVPTVDELLGVKTLGGAQISPDGRWVAYTVTESDFKQNAFVTHLWLANAQTGRTLQLTRGEKSAGNPQWSPDSDWLAFTSARAGDKSQIFALHPDGGEGVQLTKGFGHGITKPREMRAVMLHNLAWFNHYIFGDATPDFARPELPKRAEDDKDRE